MGILPPPLTPRRLTFKLKKYKVCDLCKKIKLAINHLWRLFAALSGWSALSPILLTYFGPLSISS